MTGICIGPTYNMLEVRNNLHWDSTASDSYVITARNPPAGRTVGDVGHTHTHTHIGDEHKTNKIDTEKYLSSVRKRILHIFQRLRF